MARINSYAKFTGVPADSDCFIIDSTQGTAGTRIVLWSVLKSVLTGIFAPKSHKHPGSDITSAVANADTAVNDSTGQNIASTYVKEITANGRTITVKRGNDTTFTFQTQDTNTTYPSATQSADGLMSSADKKKLDGLSGDYASAIGLVTSSKDGLMLKTDKAKLDAIGSISNGTIDGFFKI